mgnify:FL=1
MLVVRAEDGCVVEADESARRLLGECRERPLADLVDEPAGVLLELLADARRSTSPVPGRLRLRTTTGVQALSLTGQRRAADDPTVVLLVRLTDARFSELTEALDRTNVEIARRMEVEEQLRRVWSQTVVQLEHSNDQLRRIAETLAHDLRNPITTIAGFAGMVASDPELSAENAMLLERVVAAASSMQDIVEGVMREAIRTSGSTRVDVPLGDLVAWVGTLVDDQVVHLDVRDSLPVVHVSVQAVRQLLLNLVANAGKHRDRVGPVTVTVSARPVGDGRCEVRVDDDGPGVAPHLREEVFTRGTTTEEDGEHGLGLAMCRRIVGEHDGEIGLGESEAGGASFRFTLPLAER